MAHARPQKVPDGSAPAMAIDYSLGRWEALTRYLDDGDLPIDTTGWKTASGPWRLVALMLGS